MAVDPFIERAEPRAGNAQDDSHADPILQAEANAALERWLRDHAEVGGDLTETVRADIHFQELEARAREAEQALQTAEQRHATLLARHDIAGRRIFGCTIGLALVVALIGLDPGGTWLVTCFPARQKLRRHIGALWQMLLPWALGTAAPTGVDRAKWPVALKQSARQLFPVS